MKITRLRLHGYKRLLLNNIQVFELRPQSMYQLIIGTNGSGKSSVLKELSPLPAFSGDYIKGGSKTIELEHRGKSYVLTSDFTTGNKHSFMLDGEEQNPGGTMTVQRDLVQMHFQFTDSLHELLIDETRFTMMAPQKRREWITLISGGDLSYAMRLFSTLKSKARDMVGVVKHLNARLISETNKMPTQALLDEYHQTVDLLKTELTIMMEAKDPSITQHEQQLADKIFNQLNLVQELSIAIIEANPIRPDIIANTALRSMDDLNQIVIDKRIERLSINNLLEHHLKEYEKIAEIVQALEKSNAQGLEDLRNRIETLKEQSSLLTSSLRQFPLQKGSQSLLTTTTAILPELNEIFSEIPSNADNFYNRETRDNHRVNYDNLRVERERAAIEIAKLEERIEHFENAKQENCPKCGFVWTPGSENFEIPRVQAQLAKLKSIQENMEKSLIESQNYLEAYHTYAEQRRRVARTVDANPSLKLLWDHLLDNQIISHYPRKAHGIFSNWVNDLQIGCQIEDINASLLTFEAAYQKASEIDSDGHYQDNIASITQNIESTTSHKEVLTQQLKALEAYVDDLTYMLENEQRMVDTIRNIYQDLQLMTKVIRNDLLQKCISEHLSALSHHEQMLIGAKAIKDVVEDLNKSFVQAQADAEVYKILTDELSPTDGLIAEQLKGFIGCLVEQMNGIIRQIWTYDLEVMPCGIETDELDYKFPLSVNRSELIVPDISRASSSQIDVVNFAFKLVVMLYLELEDYPLYLDELAPRMDEQHRINIMAFVKQLVETRKCSQMYMISHYDAAHGSLLNADVCVMDDRNLINRPENFNRHVTIV